VLVDPVEGVDVPVLGVVVPVLGVVVPVLVVPELADAGGVVPAHVGHAVLQSPPVHPATQ